MQCRPKDEIDQMKIDSFVLCIELKYIRAPYVLFWNIPNGIQKQYDECSNKCLDEMRTCHISFLRRKPVKVPRKDNKTGSIQITINEYINNAKEQCNRYVDALSKEEHGTLCKLHVNVYGIVLVGISQRVVCEPSTIIQPMDMSKPILQKMYIIEPDIYH